MSSSNGDAGGHFRSLKARLIDSGVAGILSRGIERLGLMAEGGVGGFE